MRISNYLPIIGTLIFAACNNNPVAEKKEEVKIPLKEENITYESKDSTKMDGFVVYDESSDKKRPVVLVIHEWWGLNDYAKNRARQLAELGYLAIAVDLYGEGQNAENPVKAMELAGPFYKNPMIAKQRFDAAVTKIKTYAVADTTRIAAIGYCFGGAMAMNIARLGEDLRGIVCFHGGLNGAPLNKELLKANVLVCHGEKDQFVTAVEVNQFRRQMDSIGAKYTFKSYPDATHAFTNPDATANGTKFSLPIAYNAQADTASWNEMKTFFGTIFK